MTRQILHTLYFVLAACCVLSGAATAQLAPVSSQTPSATPASITLLREALGKTAVKIDLKEQSLAAMVDLLCRQAHCSVIIDDEPILTKADLKFEGPADQALDQITDLFDYTWEVSKYGGISLRKRFRTPLEHPQINVAELRRAARDALLTMNAVQYDTSVYMNDWTFLIHDMTDTFTPEQWHTLNDQSVPEDKRRLSMQQLTPVQRALLIQAMYRGSYYKLLEGWQMLADGLNDLPRAWLWLNTNSNPVTLNANQGPLSVSALMFAYPRTGGTSSFGLHLVSVPLNPPSKPAAKTSKERP